MKKVNIVIIFFMLLIYAYVINICNLPEKFIVYNIEDYKVRCMPGIKEERFVETSYDNNIKRQKVKIEYSLLGLKSIKTTVLTKIDDIKLIPVAKLIGLKLYTNGVLVVGTSNVEDINNNIHLQNNICEGDMIIKIDEKYISSIDEIKDVVKSSNGNELNCTLVRDGSILTSVIKPIKINMDEYRLGLWVKDAATGVGTISFINKEDNSFVALGHGIADADTGKIIDIESGEILLSDFVSITKGIEGRAGEIKGSIINKSKIGEIYKNTIFGIIGKITSLSALNLDFNKEYRIGPRYNIKCGKAVIMCELDDGVKEYDVEIKSVFLDNNFDNKSMVIEITDEELIEKTGGIIRGMSGSPILQDGKIIGVLTNVFISNPKLGYGVFMDLILNEM